MNRNGKAKRRPGNMTGGGCTTPPEDAKGVVAVHWLRLVSRGAVAVGELVMGLSAAVGAMAERRPGGAHGYSDTWVVGPVRIWHSPARPDMGVCVEVSGEACEVLGDDGLLRIWRLRRDWRVARVDLAVDHCPFKPLDTRTAWCGGDIDTRVKVPTDEPVAEEGRKGWRRCEWSVRRDGDMFTMGSRASGSYARVYNRRGHTRFELELKRSSAHAAGPGIMGALAQGVRAFRRVTVQLIQRFVRFIDRSSGRQPSRCQQLPWWSAFVGSIGKAKLWLAKASSRTLEEIALWLLRQAAPSLALIRAAWGGEGIEWLIEGAETRWTWRHLKALKQGGGPGPVAA